MGKELKMVSPQYLTSKVDGSKIAFYDHGGSDVKSENVIVMHHGHTSSHMTWDFCVDFFVSFNYRCITLDALGCGNSDKPSDEKLYTIDRYTEDLISIMDYLKVKKFNYIGHSMGGGVGWNLLYKFPSRLLKTILLAPISSQGITMSITH